VKIPFNSTEDEVLAIIEKVVNRLAYKFKFGYHDIDDIKQEARLLALEGLQNYDNNRPLENFLWTHVRNRLCNYKRDNYERLYSPCVKCHYGIIKTSIIKCNKYDDINMCSIYKGWLNRNTTKKNIMAPLELSEINDEHEYNMKTCILGEHFVVYEELVTILDKYIPVNMRADYLKLKQGLKLPRYKVEKIQKIVLDILKEHYEQCEN